MTKTEKMKENKEYQEKKEQEKVVHEPTGSYGMDTITMRQKIMERVMLSSKKCFDSPTNWNKNHGYYHILKKN